MSRQPTELERNFHQAMLGIYEAARRLKPPYNATRFLQMVNELGGKTAADTLLATSEPSDGFTELYLRGKHLELSVEYLVLRNPWRSMFEQGQLAEARKRLKDREFAPPPEDASSE